MSPKNFKVLIAGAGIAGLSLANMLEKLDIEYQMLEAHDIAPQVGASIGILPNGHRILDQIGIYDDIRRLIPKPIQSLYLLGHDGKPLAWSHGSHHLRMRHGYDTVFVDRQMVAQVLWHNLKNEDKILTNKKVKEVFLEPNGVRVTTTDGSSYTGDILIGADGIHSKIRSEMWRLADSLEPGWIPKSEHTECLPTRYKCIFGISIMETFVTDSNVATHMNKGHSYLTIPGPDNRIYWFIFIRMDKTYYGPDLPRFSKEDEDLVVKKYAHEKLTEKHTFGDLYATKISSVLTALPEYVFKKWHFNRIMTIGDASHKFNPISGQGGNSAIETAAVLVNNLTHMLKTHPEDVTTADIHACFAKTQAKREPRARKLVEAANEEQRFAALDGPFTELFVKLLGRALRFDTLIDPWSTSIEAAHRIDLLSVPKRQHLQPYDDELPARPLGSSQIPKLMAAAALFGILYIAQQTLIINPAASSPTNTFLGAPLLRTYTGIPGIDATLSLLVWAFSEAVAGPDPNFRLQAPYFLVNLITTVYIMTVEGHRNGNHMSIISLPVLFGIAYQLMGIGKVAPLYFLISLYTTSSKIYTRPTGRPIPSPVAKALLPAICLGVVIPTVAMFMPQADAEVRQRAVAFWQPFPVYVSVLTWAGAKVVEMASSKPAKSFDREIFEGRDLAPLQAGYAVMFAITAITHVCTLLYAKSNAIDLWTAFFSLPAVSTIGEQTGFYSFFKYDMVLYMAATLVWCLYSVFELRRMGYVTTEQAIKAGVAVLVGQVVVGPGAAYAGLWAWREDVIASLAMDGK